MDPLTALSLASNVVQFVDFSAKLISEGQKIYRSAEGTLAENQEAEVVAKDLKKLNDNLRRSLNDSQYTEPLSEEDQSLLTLCKKCQVVALELLDKLEKVKVSGKHRKWKSAFQALKNVSSRDDLEWLAGRLESFRSEITLHIVVSLRNRIDLLSLQQSTRFDGLEKKIMTAMLDQRTETEPPLASVLPSRAKAMYSEADLHEAASSGDRPRLRAILSQQGLDVNSKDGDMRTALHIASAGGYVGVIQTLINNHVELEVEDSQGHTALHLAATYAHAAVVRILLMNGANKHAVDDHQLTPFDLAGLETCEKAKVCLWMLKHGHDLEFRDDHDDNLLLVAACYGSESLVQDLLLRAPNTEVKGGAGMTPLIAAARNGKAGAVRALLDKQANIEATDSSGATALIRAAWGGHTNIVQMLLHNGANIEAGDSKYRTSLWWACAYNRAETVELLLNKGAKLSTRPFNVASQIGRTDIISLLLDAGVYVDDKTETGMTALMDSAAEDQPNVAELLLKHGADPQTRRDDGATALWIAAEQGHDRLAQILLNNGADIESTGGSLGSTSLNIASAQGHLVVVQMLLDHGANIECSNDHGVTPLIEAVKMSKSSRARIVEVLLDRGANIESRGLTQSGRTPLIHAARLGRFKMVRILLERGADIEAKSQIYQRSALAEACIEGHRNTTELLLQYEADVESKDRYGRTPLMHAAAGGHVKTVDELLKQGAYRGAKEDQGLTALEIAKLGEHDDVVKRLT